ncbi:MAG TPA: hypothetical protein EYG03_05765 [Planctomycetes bacterium]|nr:hypothetical protein [Fuerstiella sp.]HIK91479.1 hypothetical protein [Planctomycetota bacterium]
MKFTSAVLLPILLLASSATGQDDTSTLLPGALTEESLGQVLITIGLKPIRTEKRYDFAFKTKVRGEEWKFSMSTVLSRNGESVWVMAWLDQIPEMANDVPRTALLRLLAANDRLGNGKFFAYIPNNRRFVLQRVLRNEQMSNKRLMESLQDLAVSVADEYPTWSVASWAPKTDAQKPQIAAGTSGSQRNTTAGNRSQPTQTSETASKFGNRQVQ